MLATELVHRMLASPRCSSRTLSLKLLQTMGYGGRESLLEHTGKPGDSGLEGMVRQHALGVGTAFAHKQTGRENSYQASIFRKA